MTREEAFKIQSQFKDALHIFDDIHPNAKAYFLAEGVLSGFEQSVRASISNISEMRHLICTCPISDCPRVVAIKNTILKLLKKP